MARPSLELKDGALKGINLAQSLRSAKSMFTGGKSESEQGGSRRREDRFFRTDRELRHQKRHRAQRRSDDEVAIPALAGEGDINIAESSLNYLVKASAVATSGGQGGKDSRPRRADASGARVGTLYRAQVQDRVRQRLLGHRPSSNSSRKSSRSRARSRTNCKFQAARRSKEEAGRQSRAGLRPARKARSRKPEENRKTS